MVVSMKSEQFVHFLHIPHGLWRWKNFTPQEIACKGDGSIIVDFDALDRLQAMREDLGVPMTINSAYRSPKYNKRVGGAPKSVHMTGRAFDVAITEKLTREMIHKAAKKAGFKGFGDYNTFVHIDTGKARYWDLRK